MEIAGHPINWDGIIEKARQEALNRIREAERDTFRPSSQAICEESLRDEMEASVWSSLLKEMLSPEEERTSAEKAVAAIMKKGISKEQITFRKNSFKFRLRNRKFKIYRQTENFSSIPISSGITKQSHPCQVNGIGPETFAELVFVYDTKAMEVDEAFREILNEFRKMKLRKKKESTALEMKQKTIDLLIDEYIRPLGLRCWYSINDDRVAIELEQTKKANLDISISELADRLKDSRAILESLKIVNEVKERRSFGIWRH